MSRIAAIGGGMAGIATASHLAEKHDVVVIEREFQMGYHSTGRSAAVLHLAFENDIVHRLTKMSEPFFREPPSGFSELAETIDHIAFDTPENEEQLLAFLDGWVGRCPWLRRLSASELQERAPLLQDRFTHGTLDTQSLRLDVDALLQGYRKRLTELGGVIQTSSHAISIERLSASWRIEIDRKIAIESDILINAAGAWADELAKTAGIKPIGLQPRRRTGLIVDPGRDFSGHPMCYRATGGIYFKPEGPMLMVSPADATDTQPCDAQPDDFEVAVALDTFNQCVNLPVDRPLSAWAGLRSFAKDSCPVIGFDPDDDQFFWVAALGGFGIQTAPAYSQVAAKVLNRGNSGQLELVTEEELSPKRLHK